MIGLEDQAERVLVLGVRGCEALASDTPDGQHRRAQRWEETLAAVQRTVPGATPLRQGWCAMRARGPARYYGGETAAAEAVLACLEGVIEAGEAAQAAVGVASSRFAAEQAAVQTLIERAAEYATEHSAEGTAGRAVAGAAGLRASMQTAVRIIEAERTAEFLAPLPVSRAAGEELVAVLHGLGLHTLGAFAALPEATVLHRFGGDSIAAHRWARGLGEFRTPEVRAAAPVRDLSLRFEFEPPLDGADQLAFACGVHAERFTEALGAQGLVCTELRIELRDDRGGLHERCWSHPANFTSYDVVNRVRWQAATLPQRAEQSESTGAGIVSVRLVPHRTARAAAHEPGLWSSAPDERVHHQLTRVQSLLGYESAGTGLLTGGRLSTDRQTFVPWGSSRAGEQRSQQHGGQRPRDGPWPGSLPGALPNTVFDAPLRVDLFDADGDGIAIDADELLSEAPTWFRLEGSPAQEVQAWSAPWPLREGWWRAENLVYRLQLLLAAGEAWLLRYETKEGWSAEGRYA